MKAMTNTSLPIDDIKNEISSSIGKVITIKEFNKQRRLTNQYTGVILAAYDKLFLVYVSVNKYHLNKSFSYVNFSIGDMQYQLETQQGE